MKAFFFTVWLVFAGALLAAQTPPPSQPNSASESHPNALGFSYSVPRDWEVVDVQSTLPDVKAQVNRDSKSDQEKKGIECVQVALTARHGDPPSVVVEVALPFDCFGQSLTEKELPGFASGASEGLKQNFDLSDPVFGTYSLGTHSMWIERAKGTSKAHPELSYTIEVACSMVKKAAVCWMAMAADDSTLRVFEHGAVSLDGETPSALVPPTAFDKKPS